MTPSRTAVTAISKGTFSRRLGLGAVRQALLASASAVAIVVPAASAQAQTFYPTGGNLPDNTANSVTVANETNGAVCDLLGGNDTLTINNSTVTGATNCVAVPTSPTPTTTGTVSNVINLGDGDDTFQLIDMTTGPASIVNAGILGGLGNDTYTLSSGTVNGNIDAGSGNNLVTIAGTAVMGSVIMGAGNDTFLLSTGSVSGSVNAGGGLNIVTVAGGTLGGNLVTGAQRDTLVLSGGTISGNVAAGTGANNITLSGTVIGGNITAGSAVTGDFTTFNMSGGSVAGNVDVGSGDVTVSGGTIFGNLISNETGEDEDFAISGGAVLGAISGFDGIFITGGRIGGNLSGINSMNIQQGAGAPIVIDNAVNFQGSGPITITNTQLGGGYTFSGGFSSLTASGSTFGLGAANQNIGSVNLLSNSVLNIASGNAAINNGAGNLVVRNSTISLINGIVGDVLSVGALTLDNATLGLDADLGARTADQLLARSANLSGVNTVLINSVTPGVLLDAGTIIPISPVAGEAQPAANAPRSSNVLVRGVGTAAFNDYGVVLGSLGGVYLTSSGMNTGLVGQAGGLPRVAVDSRPPEIAARDVSRLTGDAADAFNGLSSEARAGAAISPSFGIFATGQAGSVFHDGFEITSVTPPGEGPKFRSDEVSVIGSVEYDLGKALELESTRLTIGGFGGYTSADVGLGESPALVGLGFGAVGNAKNASGIFGAYGLVGRGLYYGIGALSGFVGETDIDNSVLGTSGLYQTTGYAVTGSAGRIISLTERVRADIRVGGVYTKFFGDDFSDSAGNRFGSSEISFGSIRFEPGVFTSLQLGDYAVSPYLRGQISKRIGYNNEANIQGQDFTFDDADLSVGLQLGTNVKLTEKLEMKAEVAGRASEDSRQLTGKLGLKFSF